MFLKSDTDSLVHAIQHYDISERIKQKKIMLMCRNQSTQNRNMKHITMYEQTMKTFSYD